MHCVGDVALRNRYGVYVRPLLFETQGNSIGLNCSKASMHPPLHKDRHPHCIEVIDLFKKCHKDNPYAKFWGACNDVKMSLDRCFREEKRIKSAENRKQAQLFKERLKEKRERRQQLEGLE